MLIEHNDIGTDPTGSVPVPNGLRGIMGDGFGAEIRENVLSHNRRSGIFLWHNANIHVEVRANTIAHNDGGGIDVGLDGRTLETNDFLLGPVSAPHIDSARFDAATGDTIIEGPIPFAFSSARSISTRTRPSMPMVSPKANASSERRNSPPAASRCAYTKICRACSSTATRS